MKLNKNIVRVNIQKNATRTYSNGIFGYYSIHFSSPVVLEESDKDAKVWEDGTIMTRAAIYTKGWATFAGWKKVGFQLNTKEQAEEVLAKLRTNGEAIIKMFKEGTLTYEALEAMVA